ncbi:MAG: type I-E CRISPR-associated protein Cse1/CasA [Pseudomonadota bacterium]
MNRFNIIDEPWIPVADAGLVSVRAIFSQKDLRVLGGTPLQKIALFKLLIAIAQAASTPQDDAEWDEIGPQGMAERVLTYLEKWHDAFYLYGDKPFLQMPAVEKAELKSYQFLKPETTSNNATVLTQWQVVYPMSDAERALYLIQNMSLCFGSRNVDEKAVLSKGVKKTVIAKPGPALGKNGFLHSFLMGSNLRETVWLNIHTQEDIRRNRLFENGLGTAPWEKMPYGEDCEIAQSLKTSLMGRLVPLARFYLFMDTEMHFVEGIQHPDIQSKYADPSVAVVSSDKTTNGLDCVPEKKPWRSLTALLSFLNRESANISVECLQLKIAMRLLRYAKIESFAVWSGGASVKVNSGNQYISGMYGMVESEAHLTLHCINKEEWFPRLHKRMLELEEISSELSSSTKNYYDELKFENKSGYVKKVQSLYWQSAEFYFNELLEACLEDEDIGRLVVMKKIIDAATEAYSIVCPQDTARQMQVWAKHTPRLGRCVKSE